jgi:hypothetical protein
VGAAGADVDEPVLVEVADAPDDPAVDDGDAVFELLLQAGTNVPTSPVAAATLTTAIIRVFIRGAPICCFADQVSDECTPHFEQRHRMTCSQYGNERWFQVLPRA